MMGLPGTDDKFRHYSHTCLRHAKCGAYSRRTNAPCVARPEKGRTRCRNHGGLSTGPKSRAGHLRSALGGLKLSDATRARLEAELAALEEAGAPCTKKANDVAYLKTQGVRGQALLGNGEQGAPHTNPMSPQCPPSEPNKDPSA